MSLLVPLDLQTVPNPEGECLMCFGDLADNENGAAVGHASNQADLVWHSVHSECLRTWCMTRTPPATNMVPCTMCQAPLNVRPLFRWNSLRDQLQVIRPALPRIRLTVIGASIWPWMSVIANRGSALCNTYPKLRAFSEHPSFKMIFAGSLLCVGGAYLSILDRCMKEGQGVPFLVGNLPLLFMKNGSSFKSDIAAAVIGPLLTAAVAIANNMIR